MKKKKCSNHKIINPFYFLQTIRTLVPKLSIGDCAGGHRSENRNKSRDIMLLPREYQLLMGFFLIGLLYVLHQTINIELFDC
jgi:hypothetical protein